ncbi:MAG: hypothetical protein R2695_06110 [Acidimicrobiales bacterium]
MLWSSSTASGLGYTVLGCGDKNGTWTGTKIFVNCGSWSPADVQLPNATDLVTTGKVDIANNKRLVAPVLSRFYIGGCASCTGANYFSLSVAGSLYVNTEARRWPRPRAMPVGDLVPEGPRATRHGWWRSVRRS